MHSTTRMSIRLISHQNANHLLTKENVSINNHHIDNENHKRRNTNDQEKVKHRFATSYHKQLTHHGWLIVKQPFEYAAPKDLFRRKNRYTKLYHQAVTGVFSVMN